MDLGADDSEEEEKDEKEAASSGDTENEGLNDAGAFAAAGLAALLLPDVAVKLVSNSETALEGSAGRRLAVGGSWACWEA